jgi:hypothetical protein
MKVILGKYPKDVDKERKVEIRIDPHDTWNMDSTLAFIIHPMLVQLKATKQGSACVDAEDAPHIGVGPIDDYGSDEFVHDRWDWVLDEMIWAFGTYTTDWEAQFYTPPEGEWSLENLGKLDIEGRRKMQDRLTNAFRLFGKYYQSLWD